MWLCIRFPLLPLESLYDSLLAGYFELNDRHYFSQHPIAVSENNQIICCNRIAVQQGIHQHQTLATSYTLVDELKVIERRVTQERQLLKRIAIMLSEFSPVLHLVPPQCIQLEIGRSLKLFKGLNGLIQRIETSLQALSITYQWAIALTPKMAEIFSLAHQQPSYLCWQPDTQSISRSQCFALLRKLSIKQLFLSEQSKQKINSLGLKHIGELLALPLASLRKRLGDEAVQYIRQLIGQLPDSPECFKLPVEYIRELEFIDVIHHRETLLLPMQRLLNELCHFLRLQQKNTQLLHWVLRDSYQVKTEFNVQLAEPDNDPESSFEITRLKLDHITLTGPIEQLSLKVTQFSDIDTQSKSLFLQSEEFNDSLKFIGKIRAHLGHSSCYWLQQKAEVIPELAYQSIVNPSSSNRRVSSGNQKKTLVMATAIESRIRPCWLFKQPQKLGHLGDQLFWKGRLFIVSQEERIAGYWWKKTVNRDYFVAQHTSGAFYWIFFDHQKKYWFAHGIFS